MQHKPDWPNVFIKVLMASIIHLHIVYNCFQFGTEPILPTKPRIFTIWIFTENVCWLLIFINSCYQ